MIKHYQCGTSSKSPHFLRIYSHTYQASASCSCLHAGGCIPVYVIARVKRSSLLFGSLWYSLCFIIHSFRRLEENLSREFRYHLLSLRVSLSFNFSIRVSC